jgi:Tfp pilus assembly PilM family ATPase
LRYLKKVLAKAKGEIHSVGIDIGHASVKAVYVVHLPHSHQVKKVVEVPLASGDIVDYDYQQSANISAAISSALEQMKVHRNDVELFFALPWTTSILADRLTFKVEKSGNEKEIVLFESSQRPPFDAQDITIDYQVLKRNEEAGEIEVLLVAVQNAAIEKKLAFFDGENIRPTAYSVDAFAEYDCLAYRRQNEIFQTQKDLMKISGFVKTKADELVAIQERKSDLVKVSTAKREQIEKELGIAPKAKLDLKTKKEFDKKYKLGLEEWAEKFHNKGVVAILNFGLERGHVTYVSEGEYVLTRDLRDICFKQYIQSIKNRYGIHEDEIAEMLIGKKVVPDTDRFQQGQADMFSKISSQLNSAGQFFQSMQAGKTVEKYYVVGVGGVLAGFAQQLEKIVNAPVKVLDPFESVHLAPKFAENHEFLKTDACRFTIALGLAMRK